MASDKLSERKNNNQMINKVITKIKENFASNDIIKPLYDEVYYTILPYYLVFIIFMLITFILLIVIIVLLVNKH